MKERFFLNMVGCHGRYLGIIHGKDLAIPIDAHTADAELTGVNKASPLANMTPHPATRECLIEHRLPFHPLSLYHYGLPRHLFEIAWRCCGEDRPQMLNNVEIQKSKVKNQNDNSKCEFFNLCSVILHFDFYFLHFEGICLEFGFRDLGFSPFRYTPGSGREHPGD
jgi:hypothetical protein